MQEDFSPEIKRKIAIAVLFAICIGNMLIQNVVSFLPLFIAKNDWINTDFQLGEHDSSTILAVFSVAQIIFAPFNAKVKNKLGSKNTIQFGFVLITVTTFGLGYLARVKDPYTFFIAACALRFFQGYGDVLLQITGYSIITQIFSSDMMRYIGYVEIAAGVGLGMGPTIGSLVFGYL